MELLTLCRSGHSSETESGITDPMDADQTILFKHKKVKSKTDKFKYDHHPIPNPFIIMETELNRVDHVFIIHIFSAALRIVMAVVQLFVAIADSFIRRSGNYVFGQRENHYMHAGLNLLRGLVGLFPIVGSLVLTNRDNAEIRATYGCEWTRNTVWRQLDTRHNNFKTHLKEKKFKEADTGQSGIGSLATNMMALGKKAVTTTAGLV